MIFIIGFMLLIVSIQMLLLDMENKLEKVMCYLQINEKTLKQIRNEKEVEKIRKMIL